MFSLLLGPRPEFLGQLLGMTKKTFVAATPFVLDFCAKNNIPNVTQEEKSLAPN